MQGHQQHLYLVGCRQDAAEEPAWLERLAHLSHIILRVGHIQEQRVDVRFIESIGNIAQLESDAIRKTKPADVLYRQLLHLRPRLVAGNMPGWTDIKARAVVNAPEPVPASTTCLPG